jgi:hypothetical protein
MFNPTLLAAVTVMLLLPNPKRLMLGYLLGAYLTSISLGLLIVFTLHDSGSVETARHNLSPIEDIVVGTLVLTIGLVLKTGRAAEMRERRQRRKAEKAGEKKESLPERLLGRGSPRITFVVGVILTFPGVSYLAALDRMANLDWAAPATALLVIGFCVMQQMLLELPLIGFAVAPEWTQTTVTRFRDWLSRSGRRAAANGAVVIGALLLVRGIITLT